MAQQPTLPPGRGRAGTVSGPHSISLKVLRLSRPTLATQTALPRSALAHGLDVSPAASLAHASAAAAQQQAVAAPSSFPLTPLLTLPSAFGAAYVGETFACTLCANNELAGAAAQSTRVSAVRLVAELQTPTQQTGIPLQLVAGDDDEGDEEDGDKEGDGDDDSDGESDDDEDNVDRNEEGAATKRARKRSGGTDDAVLAPAATLQRTLRHALTDEGPHVLAVTVTYTETLLGGATAVGVGPDGTRTRTFRKLYQFVAQQLVAVRSKVTERTRVPDGGSISSSVRRQWVLEAQLENVGEASVVVERVGLLARAGVRSRPVNAGFAAVLKPQDVEQVMFIVEEAEDESSAKAGEGADAARVALAQMRVEWRSAMGEKGALTTGWLASKGR